MSRELRQQIEKMRASLDTLQKQRRLDRLEQSRSIEAGESGASTLQDFTPAADVAGLLEDLRRAVRIDVRLYVTGAPVVAADGAPALSATPSPALPPPPPAVGPFTAQIRQQLATLLTGGMAGTRDATVAHLPPGVAVLAGLLKREIANLSDASALQSGSMAAVLVPKLKLVEQALQAQRYSDCMTLLKTLLRSDPHNNLVLFLLGQLLYFLTGQGQQNALPEARDFAQRSMIFSEKVSEAKLWRYRCLAAAAEMAYDSGRALAILRDNGLLQADLLGETWNHMEGAGLYGWAMLADVPVELWTEREFDGLRDLVNDVPGGALLYLAWFRQALIEEAARRKKTFPHVEELEASVQLAWRLYGLVAHPLREMATPTQDMPWTVRLRYVRTLLQVAPLPAFDHVLLHMATNGRNWREADPDETLSELLRDAVSSYWRLWTVSMTPEREARQSHLLPAQESLDDGPQMLVFTQLLEQLRAAEQGLIRAEVWEDLKPWMVRWQLDHLLAAGSGSNQPRLRFAPTLLPYSMLYRLWSEPVPQHPLASEIIAENAAKGGFASLFEALAAFDGALRLMSDPVHGLVAGQKRALAAARQQNPGKFGGISFDGSGGKLLPLLMAGLMLGGLPAVFLLTDNWGQAVGLSLALLGTVGVVAMRLLR